MTRFISKHLFNRLRSRRGRLHVNAFYMILNHASASLSGFIFWLLAAHLYSAEEMGLAAAAFAAMTLIGITTSLGLGYGLVRFVPLAGPGAVHLINWSLSAVTVVSVMVAAIFLAGVPFWSPSLEPLRGSPLVFLFSVVFITLLALHELQGLIFLAFRRTEFILGKNLGLALIRIGFIVAFAGVFRELGVLYALGVSYLVIVALSALVLVRRVYPKYRVSFILAKPPALKFISFSLSNAASNLLIMLPNSLLPLLVIGMLGTEKNAYFYVAWTIGILLSSLSMAFALSLFAEGSYDGRELGITVRRILPVTGLMTGLGAVAVLAFGDKILMAYGREYSAEGITLLRLMAVAAFPAIGSNIYVAVLRVRQQNRHYVAAMGILAATTVGGGYLLLQQMGIAGPGASWLLGHTLVLVMAGVHLVVNRRRSRLGSPAAV